MRLHSNTCRANVKPIRAKNSDKTQGRALVDPCHACAKYAAGTSEMGRYIATSLTSRHRIFRIHDGNVLPDITVTVFARDDDYFFGVLHSRIHTLWAEATGSQLRESESALRYTPTTCFRDIPLP